MVDKFVHQPTTNNQQKTMSNSRKKIVALAGGVGGAKLADGLAKGVDADLTVIVNTGDDFSLYGLHISPDVDTVMYTLAGLANTETGWGLAGDTFQNFAMREKYGQAPWFRIGDLDMATHVLRSELLAQGKSLSQTTAMLAGSLGVAAAILPMTNDRVRTMVETPDGVLPFQEYFVKQRWQPVAKAIRFDGIEKAVPAPGVLEAIGAADLIVFCPSNPYLSLDPILNLRGLREALRNARAKIAAVSPIVGGEAIKGPAAKIMRELGIEPSPVAVARHYADLLDVFVLDGLDAEHAPAIDALGMRTLVTNTIMRSVEDRVELGCKIFKRMMDDRP